MRFARGEDLQRSSAVNLSKKARRGQVEVTLTYTSAGSFEVPSRSILGPMFLLDASHAEARRAVRSGAPVFIPVNPVEFHGPHLSLHNDSLICQGVMRDLHARLHHQHQDWEMIELRDLECGVQPVPGPGSRNVPFPIVRRVVLDACRAVADLGARRVVLMTFHGSPLHGVALEHGVRYLRRRGVHAVAPFNLMLRALLTAPAKVFDRGYDTLGESSDRVPMQAGFRDDFHAGFLETSLSLHYAPASVNPRHVDLPPCPEVAPDRVLRTMAAAARTVGRDDLARELDIAAFGAGWYALRPFPGYTGRPALASARAGAAFAEAFLDLALQGVLEALQGRPPRVRPLGWWFEYASLDGRLGSTDVSLDDVLADVLDAR